MKISHSAHVRTTQIEEVIDKTLGRLFKALMGNNEHSDFDSLLYAMPNKPYDHLNFYSLDCLSSY